MAFAEIFPISNKRISEGSAWKFNFQLSNKYAAGNSLRFTFPVGF